MKNEPDKKNPLKETITENEACIGIATCACGGEDCPDLQVFIRNARVEPNPENPEELICMSRLPFLAIPGIVASLMTHYAERAARYSKEPL